MIVIVGRPDGGSIILSVFAHGFAALPKIKGFKGIVLALWRFFGISTVFVDKFVEKSALPEPYSTPTRDSTDCTKIRQNLQVLDQQRKFSSQA